MVCNGTWTAVYSMKVEWATHPSTTHTHNYILHKGALLWLALVHTMDCVLGNQRILVCLTTNRKCLKWNRENLKMIFVRIKQLLIKLCCTANGILTVKYKSKCLIFLTFYPFFISFYYNIFVLSRLRISWTLSVQYLCKVMSTSCFALSINISCLMQLLVSFYFVSYLTFTLKGLIYAPAKSRCGTWWR